MKKIIAILLISVFLFTLFGCDKSQNASGTIKVFVGSEQASYTVDLSNVELEKGFFSVLKYLSEKENLSLSYSASAFSYYVTEFGSLKEGNGQYIYFFTSVESDFDVSSYKQEVTILGQTLVSSRVGVQDMKVENNAVYYIGLVSYGA